jgi:hypothetical protein
MPRELAHFVTTNPADTRSPRLEVRYYLPDKALAAEKSAQDSTPEGGSEAATPSLTLAPAPTGLQEHQVVVLVSHPYGPLGGNMENNVVFAVCDEVSFSPSIAR